MTRKFLVLSIVYMLLQTVQVSAQSQVVEKNAELGEVIRIVTAAQDLPYLSFSMTTVIKDSANSVAPADTIKGTYRQSGSRYWAMLDSVEYVQGYRYSLAVYHSDQLISVGKPSIQPPTMQLALLDSTFLQVHAKSMVVTSVDSVTRSFKMEFTDQSPYSTYELLYNKNTYEVKTITYFLKNGYERQDGTSATAKIVTTFSNYSSAEFSNDYFLEDKFIVKDSQGFKPAGLYEGYQIVTTGDDL